MAAGLAGNITLVWTVAEDEAGSLYRKNNGCWEMKIQRVKWKKSGAEKQMESMRSRMPPWPSMELPKSLTPRSRLIADMVSPPAKPMRAMANDISMACNGENGVIHQSPVPSATAVATPPTKPSHVLLGEMAGAILRLPSSLPH